MTLPLVLNFTSMSCMAFMLVVIGHSLKTASAAMLQVSPSPSVQSRREALVRSELGEVVHVPVPAQMVAIFPFSAINLIKLQTEKPVSPRGFQGCVGVV